jgi:hypothetical protein
VVLRRRPRTDQVQKQPVQPSRWKRFVEAIRIGWYLFIGFLGVAMLIAGVIATWNDPPAKQSCTVTATQSCDSYGDYQSEFERNWP